MPLGMRRLHARSVKGCATIMASNALALSLSPVQGALCWGSPALAAVWEVGEDADSPPVARLARALFHRHDPQEPLRLTANKSLPGCHLPGRPAWQGHLLGLACRGASAEQHVESVATLVYLAGSFPGSRAVLRSRYEQLGRSGPNEEAAVRP